jgi:hypothetical protein
MMVMRIMAQVTITLPLIVLQEFLGFLDELKCVQEAHDEASPFPPRQRRRFEFYVPAGGGEFKRVGVNIFTTGGDCRNVVQRSLIELFAQCGMCGHAPLLRNLVAMG